jgi:Vacuolar protein sorting-associated protein 62
VRSRAGPEELVLSSFSVLSEARSAANRVSDPALSWAKRRALLEQYLPQIRYDSHEAFFADGVGEMLDNPDVQLARGYGVTNAGAVIASHGQGSDHLNSDFVRAGGYPNGQPFREGDCLRSVNRDYREQARELHHRFANVAYGHTCDDEDGNLWLQYWFFYLYNDAQLGGRFGLHEGDWEMIQLRMAGSEPDVAVYAQHDGCERSDWAEVERSDDGSPLVYSGLGSHASYFRAGIYRRHIFDSADGGRPGEKLTLAFLDEHPPPWLRWEGRWGGTHPRIQKVESDSPSGPAQHRQWNDPKWFLEQASAPQKGERLRAERVRIVRRGPRPRIDFDFEEVTGATPDRLLVTINSDAESALPPTTYTFVVDQALRGSLEPRHHLDPAKPYDVTVSWLSEDGRQSEVHTRVLPPLSNVQPARWLVELLVAGRRLWQKIARTH